jgi:hypothetical protein
MGTKQTAGLANALFPKVRQRVLGLFFGQPANAFQLTQVIKLVGSGTGAVQRELEKLTRAGILNVSFAGTRKVYQVNWQSPIFDELSGLILKTSGLLEPVRSALKSLASKIDVAFVYGSVAKRIDTAKSDIDLMIIGQDIAYAEMFAALQKAEKNLLRPINPNLMSPGEWRQKTSERNAFIRQIEQQPKLFVFGTDDDLKRIGQSG